MARLKTHEEFMNDFQKFGNKNIIILGCYINSKTKILVKCVIDGHEWYATPDTLLSGRGCPVCAGLVTIDGINSLATLRPDLLTYFVNPEDATKVTTKSNRIVFLKCPDCGELKAMTANMLSTRGFSCSRCGQFISYPNRLIRSIMCQLDVDYLQYEWSQKWTCGQKYDVYFEINGHKYVIEMQGEQHYGAGWNKNVPKDKIVLYDIEKAGCATLHGITPIIIDARISDFNFIFQNIKCSLLSMVIDMSKLDIKKCKCDAEKNIVKEVCNEYAEDSNILIESLAKKYMVNRNTITNYLKRGSKLGWCDYNSEKSWQRFKEKVSKKITVYTINHEEVLKCESIQDATRKLHDIYCDKFSATSIARAIKSAKPYKGLYFECI